MLGKIEFCTSEPIRVVVVLAASFVAALLGDRSLSAEDWMFRRSYYSHAPEEGMPVDYPLPQSRSAYRPAYVGRGPGFAARGVYRYNTMYLRSGTSSDVTIFREHSFEASPWPW